jgi:phosphopantothenoylcysteine decarboxylase/phosphopantothenate--cysteine ligase
MNPHMWHHAATQRNVAMLEADGIHFVGPNAGEMAERNEAGPGRMAEPHEILAAIERLWGDETAANIGATGPLAGRHVLITAGPTHEPIDPVRYIANRSSGKQGYALAAAARALGARVTLVSGPTDLPIPLGVFVSRVESAREMLATVEAALPADVGIFTAAVADWRVAEASGQKIKKDGKQATPTLTLVENPDILKTVGHAKAGRRPPLVVGFAAETENVIENARKKRKSKAADWIVANDVSPATGIMGGDRNAVHIVSGEGVESWPDMDKGDVARRLMERVATWLAENTGEA